MKMRHPKRGRMLNVPEDRSDMYRTQGWVEVDESDACPTCGASGDDPCVTSGGNETAPHANRP